MKVQAAVLYETNSPLKVETLDLAPPQKGEVLVKMGAAGVCHSDYHVISGQAGHEFPVVLGHEGAGTVIALGEEVKDLNIGDHVVLSWIPYCKRCYFCCNEQTHLCQTYKGPLWDGTMMDGTCRFSNIAGPVRHLSMLACWADHAVVPQQSCIKLDRQVPFEIAALLGCAVTTGVGAVLNRAKVKRGSSVVVIGAGGVGLSVIMAAKLAGAKTIIAIDASIETKERAIELGATDFVHADQDVTQQVLNITEHGADYVFEAVGKRALQLASIDYCRSGGKIVFVGMDSNDATIALPSTRITREEKIITGSIFGSACTDRDFALYAQYYLQGKLPIDQLIGRHYKLEDINRANEDMLAGKSGRGVIMFEENSHV